MPDYIVLPDIVISKDGPVEDAPIRFARVHQHPLLDAAPKKWPPREEHQEALEAIVTFLPQVNIAAVTGAIIGWIFAVPWCALIRQTPGWGGFPHLVIFGKKGSGKTATIKLIMRIFGLPATFDPDSAAMTPFIRLLTLSVTNLIPAFIDEFRLNCLVPREMAAFNRDLRAVYGGEVAQRGTPSLDSVHFTLCAPFCLGGEDRPRDPAGSHRIIPVYLEERTLDSETHTEAFDKLNEAPLEAFILPFLSWSLVSIDWLMILREAKKDVFQWLDRNGYAVHQRVVNNLAIVAFGLKVFKTYAEHRGVQPPEMNWE